MPRRTSYSQGVPNRVELRTTDRAAAQSFYGRLFGWEFSREHDDGPSTAVKDGGLVAEISTPHSTAEWITYLAVDDVDIAAAKVEPADGRLLTSPYDVMDAGRAAIAADPTGVTVGLWQAGTQIGATIVNEPGTFIWSELMTAGGEAAAAFYEQVFGLTTTVVDMDGSPFTGFLVGDDLIGGLIPLPWEGVQPRWIVYFAVADAVQAAERAEALGGTVLHGPIDTPVGPLAALRDPQGAAFSVWAYNGPTR